MRLNNHIKTALNCLLLCSSIFCVNITTQAASLAVVTNPENPLESLAQEDVAKLFMGVEDITEGENKLIPVDAKDAAMREVFYTLVAKRSLNQVRTHWAKKVFMGEGRPPKQLSEDKLVQKLHENPHAITYLPIKDINGFKVLLTIE